MSQIKIVTRNQIREELINFHLATNGELSKDEYPLLQNISAAFIYNCLPIPEIDSKPEYIYIHSDKSLKKGFFHNQVSNNVQLLISKWNMAWESGHYRYDILHEDIPNDLKWLEKFTDKNIFLIPRFSYHRYAAFSPLYHLLPKHILQYNRLPLLKKGQWPPYLNDGTLDYIFPKDFDERLSQAFAFYIWPFLISGSKISAFNSDDSIKILAHNLDYWLPHIYTVAEKRLKNFGRAPFTESYHEKRLLENRKTYPDIRIERPLKGGMIWMGEEEAKEVTKEMIEYADKNGSLRNIIDAIKSNRVRDDFSEYWSFAKEDFERKLYNKRSKYQVNFIELTDTIPVQGPETEIEENRCWEDFIALLDAKEKRIVVCIREGFTKVGEISKILGYTNHSPVSKALRNIREKAKKYIENSE